MPRFRCAGISCGIAGALLGFLVGGLVGSLIAFAGVSLLIPPPEAGHGPDPIAVVRALFDVATRVFWIAVGGSMGGTIGAAAGAIAGTRRGARSHATGMLAEGELVASDEISALKARIAELEQRREPD